MSAPRLRIADSAHARSRSAHARHHLCAGAFSSSAHSFWAQRVCPPPPLARAVGTGIQTNRLGHMRLNPQMGMGGTPAVQAGLLPGLGGMLPSDGPDTVSMANFQRVLAFLQVTLEDWMPEAPPQTKLLRASQMDVGDGADTVSMANSQRVLAFLQVTLRDWIPEALPTKLLRALQMDVGRRR